MKAVLVVASELEVISINVCSLGWVTALIHTGSQPAGPGFDSMMGAFEGICDISNSPFDRFDLIVRGKYKKSSGNLGHGAKHCIH
jgi:hypothetical protein